MFVIMFIIFILLYSGVNYYVGRSLFKNINSVIPFISSKIYWVIFVLISCAYILGKFMHSILPEGVYSITELIGSYWLSAVIYFLILLSLLDLLRLSNKLIFKFNGNAKLIGIINITFVFLIIGMLVYGTYNANNSKIVNYEVNIDKKVQEPKEIRAVMVSDIHLGSIIKKDKLKSLVKKINTQNPDIVFFVGDIIDESIITFQNQKMGEEIKKIKSRFGIYGVYGNHEYMSKDMNTVKTSYQKAGIKILADNFQLIDNSFYIIGREDISRESFYKTKRKPLKNILSEVDKTKPLILLDHQPSNTKDAENSKIDLQLSGHTHKGQFFPNNLITSKIFENDWGILSRNGYNLIVSSGYGTWGPPIRIGSNSEILLIKIKFH